MKKRRFAALLLAAGMAMSLMACGGKNSTDLPETKETGGSAETTAPVQEEAGDKVINVGITTDPQSVCPLNDNNGTAFEISAIMFMPLVELNDQLEYENALAENITTEDNVTFTVALKQGIKWSDGEDVTADDVIFTLNAITNPAVGSTVASYLNCISGTEDTGWRAEGSEALEGVEKADDYTIKITCKNPITMEAFKANVGKRLRTVPEHILKDIPAENILQSDFAIAPTVGNGAFLFSEYVSGQYVSLTANADYYKGAPKLSKLNLVILTTTQMATQLETGEIDIAYPGSVDSDDYEQLMSLPHISAVQGDPISIRELIINCNKIDNVKARQAMNLAIDRAMIVDKMMGGYANAQATVVTDASKYYNEEANKTTFDAEKAKQLLEESGWDASQPLTLNVASGSELNTRIATLVSQELQQTGFNVTISESDMPTLMSGLFAGEFDLALMNITDDPMNLPFNFSALVDAASDWTGYSNDHMQELLKVIVSIADESEIAAAYAEIQEIIAEDVPAVTLYASRPMLFKNTRVTHGDPKLYGMFCDLEQWDVQ